MKPGPPDTTLEQIPDDPVILDGGDDRPGGVPLPCLLVKQSVCLDQRLHGGEVPT